jgi:hypothetical protein
MANQRDRPYSVEGFLMQMMQDYHVQSITPPPAPIPERESRYVGSINVRVTAEMVERLRSGKQAFAAALEREVLEFADWLRRDIARNAWLRIQSQREQQLRTWVRQARVTREQNYAVTRPV